MRILLAAKTMGVGGLERIVVGLARELTSRGHEVWVVSSGGQLVDELRQAGTQRAHIKISPTGGAMRLLVISDGEKIDPEDREKIFEPYARPSKQAPVGHGVGH